MPLPVTAPVGGRHDVRMTFCKWLLYIGRWRLFPACPGEGTKGSASPCVSPVPWLWLPA